MFQLHGIEFNRDFLFEAPRDIHVQNSLDPPYFIFQKLRCILDDLHSLGMGK